ncbi:hypothetical protein ACFQV4_28295 [Streptomyces thermocarboxydus]
MALCGVVGAQLVQTLRPPPQHPGVGDRAGLRRGPRRAGADARRQPLLRLRPLGPVAWTGVALAIALSALAPAWNAWPRYGASTPWRPASPGACWTRPAPRATSCTRASRAPSPEPASGVPPWLAPRVGRTGASRTLEVQGGSGHPGSADAGGACARRRPAAQREG